MNFSEEYKNKIKTKWEKISKENIDIEIIDGIIYGFCSELASLRLLKSYRFSDLANVGYLEDNKSFYFCLKIIN